MSNLVALVPLVIFLVLALTVSLVVRRRTHTAGGGFVKEYFIGNRALGGFVLAMTTIATYGSVSSFVGGPGQAWLVGWGWVYMAVVQVTALVLLYGILGKKMALVSRKLDAVTVIDVIRARYSSNALANVSAVVVVLFFAATMVAQFVGGAKLFEAVTGYSYLVGLVLFGVAVVLFTTIGGFRGVAVTDAICGVAMLIGIFVLAAGILAAGGGYENIMDTIRANRPEMLEPFGGGSMPATLYFTQWLLVGIFTFVLPQSAVRCMGFKNTKSLHSAMWIGAVTCAFVIVGMHLAGVWCGALIDTSTLPNSDYFIPTVVLQIMPVGIAGLFLAAPLAAVMSTVSSLLILASAAIIKDIYHTYYVKDDPARLAKYQKNLGKFTIGGTLLVGIVTVLLALNPPDIIWVLNLFAMGGLECAFFWPLVGGLFFKKGTKQGAVAASIGGAAFYIFAYYNVKVLGINAVVWGLLVSAILYYVVSYATCPKEGLDKDVLEKCF